MILKGRNCAGDNQSSYRRKEGKGIRGLSIYIAAQLSRRLVFRRTVLSLVSLDEQRSGAAHHLDNGETLAYALYPSKISGGHAHASPGPRAKEEAAALGGRREDTRCIVRVDVAHD